MKAILAAVATAGSVLGLAASSIDSPAAGQAPPQPPPAAAAPVDPAAELTLGPWLYEIVRHLYRWYIDERDVDAMIRTGEVVFWVRETKPVLDDGDRSLFGEVLLPQLSLLVKVKRADYTIPELNAVVKNSNFKITSVGQTDAPERKPDQYVETRANYVEMRDYLFKTRAQALFPEGELLERIRTAARTEILKELNQRKEEAPPGAQVVHLAPLSPIANETWAFWESGRMLIRFVSDIDLSNPAVWEHETLAVRLYHLDRKVVVSLDEVAGSNAFMTRDEAGRALFNCIILGKRVELQPPRAQQDNADHK